MMAFDFEFFFSKWDKALRLIVNVEFELMWNFIRRTILN